MKKLYVAPTCELYFLMQEEGILSASSGSGSGSNMNDPDYGQNPF